MLQTRNHSFLRYALGFCNEPCPALSEKEWVALHKWAEQQSLLGVIYGGIQKLPADRMPPMKWALRWSMEAEHIRGLNRKVNDVAVRLTNLFDEQGVRSFILKGSANTLVYPDPSLRQTGDVDVWVDGGRSKVVSLLEQMNLMDGSSVSSLHVHLDDSKFGEEVEIHFIATRQHAPVQNAALQQFMAEESKHSYKTSEGFNVPPMTYALMMQLSHIKQHLFSSGVGLKQLVDYYLLLQHSSEDERALVSKNLNACGLDKMAGAVMYVLNQVLMLDEKHMLCAPDVRRGKNLYRVIFEGGNFGWYAEDYVQPVINRWIKDRVRALRLLPFDAKESIWHEIHYLKDTLVLIPKRIRQRRLALGNR